MTLALSKRFKVCSDAGCEVINMLQLYCSLLEEGERNEVRDRDTPGTVA